MKKKRVKVARTNKVNKTFTITALILFLIFLLIIVACYFLIVQPKSSPQLSPSNIKVNYTGVYTGFTPTLGYYFNFSGRFLTLWNSSGSFYIFNGSNMTGPNKPSEPLTNYIPSIGYFHPFGNQIALWNSSGNLFIFNGNSWNSFIPNGNGTDGKIPAWFKPVAGYYHGFGGRVVLWNSSGQFIIFNGTRWNAPATPTNLPAGKAPVVAYYAFFDRPLSCEFSPVGDLNNDLSVNTADQTILANMISAPSTKTNCSDINGDGLVNPLDATLLTGVKNTQLIAGGNAKLSIALWYNDNRLKLYTYNGTGQFIPRTFSGLPPNAIPTTGYFDGITNKVVLWFGSDAYESDNGTDFTQVQIACIPVSAVCGDWNSCSQGQQSRSCFNGCTESTQTQICSCEDSDADSDLPDYYQYGNVSYRSGTNPLIVKNDTCLSTQNLTEWSCYNTLPKSFNYTCPNGCANGFCTGEPEILCKDSDNGKEYDTKGTLTFYLDNQLVENVTDSCDTTQKLKEGYCNENGLSAYIFYNCSSCANGVCIGGIIEPPQPEPECENGQEVCDEAGQYILCANGYWLDPVTPPAGKCTTESLCVDDFECADNQICNDNGQCEDKVIPPNPGGGWGWIILIIILIIVILAVAGAIIYVFIQRNKANKKPKSGPAPGSLPRPPSSLPPSSTQTQQKSSMPAQRIFEQQR